MKIVGFHSGHDSSYSILEDGVSIVHNELERFNRRKNSVADSIQFFLDNEKNLDDKNKVIEEFKKSKLAQDIQKAFPDAKLVDLKEEE